MPLIWTMPLARRKNHLCSADLREFIAKYHLDLATGRRVRPSCRLWQPRPIPTTFTTRPAPGTCCATLNPTTWVWDGPDADYTPASDDLPWCMVPEKKITPEDVKYVLSSHYQGTPYDPYASYGDQSRTGVFTAPSASTATTLWR